jgi:hypothetical protein
MSNTYITSSLVAPEAHTFFSFHNVAIREAMKDYQNMWSSADFKAGDTVKVRKPNFAELQRGNTVTAKDSVAATEDLTWQDKYSVAFEVTDTDLQRNIQDFNNEFTMPAMRRIANGLNRDVWTGFKEQVYMTVGSAASAVSSPKTSDLPRVILEEMGIPFGEVWYQVLNPTDSSELRASVNNNFNQMVTKDVLAKGALGNLGSFDLFTDQLLPTHTTFSGTIGTPLVNGAVTSGNTIVADSFTASQTGILKKGDIVTFTGVNRVELESKTDTGRLFQAVVLADADSDGSGNVTFTISPSIVVSGPRKNISTASIPDNAAITVESQTTGSYRLNAAYRKDALILISKPLPAYRDLDSSTTSHDGLSIRVTIQSDAKTSQQFIRYDLQAAFKWEAEWAAKLISKL